MQQDEQRQADPEPSHGPYPSTERRQGRRVGLGVPYRDYEKAKANTNARRRARRAAGLCVSCAEPSKTSRCHACESKQRDSRRAYLREYHRKWRAKHREARRASVKRHRQKMKAAGLCVGCGKVEPAKGMVSCPTCIGKDRKRHHAARDRRKASRILRQYGITMAQWQEMFVGQNNRCAICLRADPGPKGWQTDHCHAIGKVRGILCVRCNNALGGLMDDPIILQRAARYLIIRGTAKQRQAPLVGLEKI